MKRLMPLGTIVMLDTESKSKLMIIGRLVKKSESENKIWDYCACSVPVGITDNNLAFFDHNQVARLLFIGYQDEEEMQYSYACKQYDNDSDSVSKKVEE